MFFFVFLVLLVLVFLVLVFLVSRTASQNFGAIFPSNMAAAIPNPDFLGTVVQ